MLVISPMLCIYQLCKKGNENIKSKLTALIFSKPNSPVFFFLWFPMKYWTTYKNIFKIITSKVITYHITGDQIYISVKTDCLQKKKKYVSKRKKNKSFIPNFSKPPSYSICHSCKPWENDNRKYRERKNDIHDYTITIIEGYIRHLYRTHVSHTWSRRRNRRKNFLSPIPITFSPLFNLLKWLPDSPNDGFRWGLYTACLLVRN